MVQKLDLLGSRMEVSIVLPAYNEVERLSGAVSQTLDSVRRLSDSFEVIIAEDGSTDGTDRLAASLSEKYRNVRHLHSPIRLGRGKALNRAFKEARGEILVYMDVDLSTDTKFLEPLIKSIREGCDFATGSRMLPESEAERTKSRKWVSMIYNRMVRALLRSPVRDHQCGFKAFKREPLLQILDEVSSNHWFWDTELLVLASRHGYRIKEIPIVWKGKSESKVTLIRDATSMGFQTIKLWWKLLKKNKGTNK